MYNCSLRSTKVHILRAVQLSQDHQYRSLQSDLPCLLQRMWRCFCIFRFHSSTSRGYHKSIEHLTPQSQHQSILILDLTRRHLHFHLLLLQTQPGPWGWGLSRATGTGKGSSYSFLSRRIVGFQQLFEQVFWDTSIVGRCLAFWATELLMKIQLRTSVAIVD